MKPFTVNFGNAKPLELPPPGNYSFRISDYEVKEAKNEDSRAKGFNIALTFDMIDEPEYPSAKMWYNLWVHYENPWAAAAFFTALTGKDVSEEEWNEEMFTDKARYIGDTIGCNVKHEPYETGGVSKVKLAPATAESWYTV